MKSRDVKLCTFDNPATMTREHWVNGEYRMHIQASLLLSKDFKGGDWFPMQLNTGPWEPGKLIGDRAAMSEEVR